MPILALSTRLSALLILALVAGCKDAPSTPADSGASPAATSDTGFLAGTVLWAVNVGGPAYHGVDGVHYMADEFVSGGETGELPTVRGTQDSLLFKTYRIGDIRVEKPLPNGTYDVSFRFAEPQDLPVGGRVFTVFAEGVPVMKDMDVRLARDGQHHSALDRSVTDIEVSDGALTITFEASAGESILSGLVVWPKYEDSRAWELVWSDEFEYTGPPDSSLWSTDVWPARKVNDEDQAYTGRAQNVRVENGRLILEAHRESYEGAEYTSGRIHSAGKGDLLYGRIDARAKLPGGMGTWAAIWMLPTDPYRYSTSCEPGEDWQGSRTCDAWPNSGEIDIMEHVGYDMNRVHGTVHTKAYFWINWEQRKASVEARNVDQEFHVYSVQWTPDVIHVLYDGTPYFSYTNEGAGWEVWPFDHPYHVILNLAVGGAWGRAGGGIDANAFPTRMEVDYVRAYKHANP